MYSLYIIFVLLTHDTILDILNNFTRLFGKNKLLCEEKKFFYFIGKQRLCRSTNSRGEVKIFKEKQQIILQCSLIFIHHFLQLILCFKERIRIQLRFFKNKQAGTLTVREPWWIRRNHIFECPLHSESEYPIQPNILRETLVEMQNQLNEDITDWIPLFPC